MNNQRRLNVYITNAYQTGSASAHVSAVVYPQQTPSVPTAQASSAEQVVKLARPYTPCFPWVCATFLSATER
jgi:hypothetical protein